MGGHVRALEHLRKSTKCAYDALNHLKGGCGALAERMRQAVGIVRITRHAPVHASHASIHAPVAPVTTIH